MASAGHPIDPASETWNRLNGVFRRFPIGVRKIGTIAQNGQSLEVRDVSGDCNWIARPEWVREQQITSFAGHPLVHRGQVLGVLGLFSRQQPGESCFEWLRMIADHLAAAIANARALEEIESLKRRLELENEYLREEAHESSSYGELVGQSPALQAVARQIDLVAPTDSSVLILGESGTGKELVARELHRRSRRADKPFIKVNCAAVPRELYESEFFGHAKGSFTGALRDRTGRFELADGGTLFLDEIGEIPLDLQAKLLRVLQEGELERVGDERTRRVDVRVISATNRKLREESDAGRFRQDLYYRLSVSRSRFRHCATASRTSRCSPNSSSNAWPASWGIDACDSRWPTYNSSSTTTGPAMSVSCSMSWNERRSGPRMASCGLSSPRTHPRRPGNHPQTPRPNASLPKARCANSKPRTSASLYKPQGKNLRPDGAAAQLGIKPTTLASRIKALGIRLDSQ